MSAIFMPFNLILDTTYIRSSATAERQRVSYARLSRLAHWSCTSL